MRLRSLATAACTLAALVVASPATAHANSPCGPRFSPQPAPPTTSFFENYNRLGPDPLPTADPVGSTVRGYQRFGGQSEGEWKKQWLKLGQTEWNWPPSDGFDLTREGKVDKYPLTLTVGKRLDRFGYAEGRYLADVGVSFGSRALPPQTLNTPDGAVRDQEGRTNVSNAIIPPSNYHVYCVLNPFKVEAGPIAPYFGQPGRAIQYLLTPGYVDGQPNDKIRITWLLSNGPKGPGTDNPYLVEVAP